MPWHNGLYRATTLVPPHFTLMLRVDLNEGFSPDGFISADLFRGDLGALDSILDLDTPLAKLQFLGSFRSDRRPNEAASPVEKSITLKGNPASLGNILLLLRTHAGPDDAPHRIRFLGSDAVAPVPTESIDFVAVHHSTSLRFLTLETDVAPGLPRPHELRVPVVGGGSTTLRDALAEAGFLLVDTGFDQSTLPNQGAWTLDQLAAHAMKKPSSSEEPGFFHRFAGVSLRTYLMIASELSGNSRVTGAMFDPLERRAAAVFFGALQNAFGHDQAELNANYLFTTVHEIAHCLNQPHAFEALSKAAQTFMNYPQEYTGGFIGSDRPPFRGAPGWTPEQLTNYLNFWSVFRYRFDAQELLALRHGPRNDVAVGDGVTRYRGALSAATAAFAMGGSAGEGMRLTLRVKRGNDDVGAGEELGEGRRRIFEFAEPIHIEARLRSNLKEPRPVDMPLSPMSGGLEIHYQTPDDQFRTFVPPVILCHIGERPKFLDGSEGATDPDAFYNDICLNYNGSSISFLTPGRYRIRASYQLRDSTLVSNVLDIFVRFPTPQVEDAVVPLLGSDFATYFSFRGVSGLAKVKESLLESAPVLVNACQATPNGAEHPLLRYFYAYQGRLEKDAVLITKALAEKGGSARLSVRKKTLLPFSNIMLGKVGAWLHEATHTRSSKRNVVNWIEKAMARRKVPTRIINRYRRDLIVRSGQ